MVNISNLKEKIYLLCYSGPISKAEISRKLYKKSKKHIYSLTIKLKGDWWDIFNEEDMPEELKENIGPSDDGRLKTSLYCYAKPKILMESIVFELSHNSITLEESEYEIVLSFISSDGFREYVSKHLDKFIENNKIRAYPDDFYPLKLALGQTFYLEYYINEMLKTELSEYQDIIKGFQQKYSVAHNLLPGLEDEMKKFSPKLIKKIANLNPAGNYDIQFMFDYIFKLSRDLDEIRNR